MMEVSKVLLYCAKAKPYLLNRKDYPYDIPEKADFILRNEKQIKKDIIGDSDFVDGGDLAFERSEIVKSSLNGKVCFECDCKEAKQVYIYESESYDDEFHSFGNCDFVKDNFRRMGLSDDAESTGNILDKYGNYWLYFYHFENVKPIDPMPITHLFKDEDCTIPITRAPQSYCFAYQKCNFFDKKVHPFPPTTSEMRTFSLQFCTQKEEDRYFYSRKVLIFSIKSPWLALEVNIDPKTGKPYKDLEVKKQRILNAGIEYK